MGGVAVANGSTLSATGEMQVTCNAPYVLSVDGVEWMPTASAGGVDTYLLSTSGVVRIFINGTRYFIFKNTITADFEFSYLDVYEMEGTDIVNSHGGLDRYYQGPIVQGSDRIIMNLDINNISPSMTRAELVALGGSCSQGSINVYAHGTYENIVQVEVENFSTSTYNAVFLGNVLLAFFEPAE